MLVSAVIEINYLQGKYEDRVEYNLLQKIGLGLSLVVLVFGFIIQISFIVLAIIKQKDEDSKIAKLL